MSARGCDSCNGSPDQRLVCDGCVDDATATLRAEVESLKAQLAEAQKRASDLAAWHPHSAVGMTRMVAAEEQLRVAQEALEQVVDPNLNLRDPDEVNWALVAAALSASAPKAEPTTPCGGWNACDWLEGKCQRCGMTPEQYAKPSQATPDDALMKVAEQTKNALLLAWRTGYDDEEELRAMDAVDLAAIVKGVRP